MLGKITRQIFGTHNDRVLRSLQPFVAQVNELEHRFQQMSDEELKAQTPRFREQLDNGASVDDLLPEAFAVVRETAIRTLEMRHFDVQIIGGVVLHQGKIAEMKTGEGKTLVATLPAYLNALSGNGVHIVTVNDYLARRDSEWMGKIFRFLGLSVGVIYPGLDEEDKLAAYRADITYGQNNEFGFDYLRDNMKFQASALYQRGHHFAIVDEVDSILIDEARTPLIISGPAEESTDKYYAINKIIPRLVDEEHFEIDLKSKQPSLTDAGVAKVEELLKVSNLYDPSNIDTLHHVMQAITAHHTKERDVDYVVQSGQVVIVDEFTGRLMPGRRWSNGLHQAIEAKEGLSIAQENQTLASITFQNYFRMYDKLAGMTGTADTEAAEFAEIYKLDVVVVPTNEPMVRDDQSDKVFRTRKEKYQAVVDDIEEINKTGQPILVGTISIEQSESLAKALSRKKIPHNVLNAKQHEREAEIVAQAGRLGAVTISTNMAGRGTDIMLGGNPAFLTASEVGDRAEETPEYQEALARFRKSCGDEKAKVLEAGGLFIMGTERHESRRIDNQLRGRSGRQGDPGVSRFYVSLEDDLMVRFGGERMQNIMSRLGWEEGLAIDGRMISRSIEQAQKRVEGLHFESRKHVTQYDDVMNKQRQVVYDLRARVLLGEDFRDEVKDMLADILEGWVLEVCDEKKKPREWDITPLFERISEITGSEYRLNEDIEFNAQAIFDRVREDIWGRYLEQRKEGDERLAELNKAMAEEDDLPFAVPEDFSAIERSTLLEVLDHYWNLHLQDMDQLREGIGLRGYGQKNPLHEYQREGFLLFEELMQNVREQVMRGLFHYRVREPRELIAHMKLELEKRRAFERRMEMAQRSGGDVEQGADETKSPREEREKRMQQRKARRRKKK